MMREDLRQEKVEGKTKHDRRLRSSGKERRIEMAMRWAGGVGLSFSLVLLSLYFFADELGLDYSPLPLLPIFYFLLSCWHMKEVS